MEDPRRLIVGGAIGFALAGRPARAQPVGADEAPSTEIRLTKPLVAAPALIDHPGAIPARWEWSYWAGVGASQMFDRRWEGMAGLGFELTTGVATFAGFPAGPCLSTRRRFAEVRTGPWVSGTTRSEGAVLEGGWKVHLGGVYQASFGTFDLRAGSGHGDLGGGRGPLASITLAWGVRSSLDRYYRGRYGDPPPVHRPWAMASVARVFWTFRTSLGGAGSEMAFGLELSPTFLFGPYSPSRLWGGPP